MAAGDYRHLITVQRPISVPNAHNQPVYSWDDPSCVLGRNVPARVEELTGRELANALQMQPDVSVRVTLPWPPFVVSSDCRLIWHDFGTNRILSIESPPLNLDGRRITMTLLCKEGPKGGI